MLRIVTIAVKILLKKNVDNTETKVMKQSSAAYEDKLIVFKLQWKTKEFNLGLATSVFFFLMVRIHHTGGIGIVTMLTNHIEI